MQINVNISRRQGLAILAVLAVIAGEFYFLNTATVHAQTPPPPPVFAAPQIGMGSPIATDSSQCALYPAHSASLCPVENTDGSVTIWLVANGKAPAKLVAPAVSTFSQLSGTVSAAQLPPNTTCSFTLTLNAGSTMSGKISLSNCQ